MWHKYYALQTFPILLLHTYIVRCIEIKEAYHRPLTDILEILLCSVLLKTYQCTGTNHTYWILLEICFISHTEQVPQHILEIEMTCDCCTLYFTPCIIFCETHSLPKLNFHSPNEVSCQDKLQSSVSFFLLSRVGSCLEYSYLRSEQNKFLFPLSCLMLHWKSLDNPVL